MRVLKFGGTSIGKPERMKHVAGLINDGIEKLVVLSATSGTTNKLSSIAQSFYHDNDPTFAQNKIAQLESYFQQFIQELYDNAEGLAQGKLVLEEHFGLLKGINKQNFDVSKEKLILAQGELISTKLFTIYAQQQGMDLTLIPALDFMRISQGEPDSFYIKGMLNQVLKTTKKSNIYLTQGYICLNENNKVDNLRRGGSDYTAALIGAAINADEIQIWTDIDGVHNNDPRFVKNTTSISHLSFNEAAELAYFGAKVLHPASVLPAQKSNIPVRLLNTMAPDAPGTIIDSNESNPTSNIVKAIAAKDNITAIKINSSRMLFAYGFLKKVFEVFEKYKTPIDLITTSEVAVSLTIDDNTYLEVIKEELKQFASVEVDLNQTIVCLVGRFKKDQTGLVNVLKPLDSIPIRMISLGGSEYNISILVDTTFKQQVLERLHEGLF